MMRIIAGTSRGRHLISPRGKKTRPTSDRVKAAFFNIIGNYIKGADFLDLFSGSGSIGIEALSRGAKRCVFVEKNPDNLKLIRKNLKLTDLYPLAEILPCDVSRALKILHKRKECFHVVYLDPPYHYEGVLSILHLLHEYGIIYSGGIVGVERDSHKPGTWLKAAPFQPWQKKIYGNTMLILFRELEIS
ncbi:MAG TPA: 16S rRNA (guanine(966)-N(2))-methyltransferase RsmD [Firmicutes bacterium]|jgi:16S rRNA (guanine966-N2)-methyltransferase|nr:16S rRNA (guanine(966)-N(2))-methyltransferase RsmD [Bacillota bacterium]